MNRRELENAIRDEAAAWPGVAVEFEEGGKHPKAVLSFNGLIMRRAFGANQDHVAFPHKMIADMRRVMTQLGATRSTPEPSKEEIERRYSKPNDGKAKRPDPVAREKAPIKAGIAEQLQERAADLVEKASELADSILPTTEEMLMRDDKPAAKGGILSRRAAEDLATRRPDLELAWGRRIEIDPSVHRSGWGVYTDIEAIDYHLDPAPEPSISCSLMGPLLTQTARDFAFAHPRRDELIEGLEPDPERRKTTVEMIRGDVVHQLTLGKGRGYAVGDEKWKRWDTKDAKAFKAEAEEAGLSPIKHEDFEKAEKLAAILREKIKRRLDGADYQTEVVILYQEMTDFGPIWVRCMADIWCPEKALILDPKVTGMLYDGKIERHAIQMGWDRQAAIYPRAMGHIFPELAGRIQFEDLLINPEGANVTRFWAPERAWLASSLRQCLIAFERFGECISRKDWPGFGFKTHRGAMPPWEDKRRTEMELGS